VKKKKPQPSQPGDQKPQPPAHTVQLPGFVIEKDIGLGSVIKRATYAMGFRGHCAGCERRAQKLDQWMRFTRSK